MPSATMPTSGRQQVIDPLVTSKKVLDELFGPPADRSFAVRLWDGTLQAPSSDDQVPFTIAINRPGALRRMLLPPSELAIGEAFLRNDFDVEGDLEDATALADQVVARLRSPVRLARVVSLLRDLPTDDLDPTHDEGATRSIGITGRRHSRLRDRAAVRSHYDVGNDFYSLWLDSRMVYSCGYFEDESVSLDDAQLAKLDLVCRKLRLSPGERLLDIGCGWGSLVIHAASRYGVDATGITLSERQAELGRMRIAEAGLSDRCRVEILDYRELPRDVSFDKIASVGMVEHVGRTQLGRYFSEVYRLLRPGGLFLNHGIVELPAARRRGVSALVTDAVWKPRSFLDRYVFPDGELVPLAELITSAESAGFETRDAESLREHYTLTLRHWVHRLEDHRAEACRLVGERTYRIWRLYMSGAARGFATGRLNVVQTLLGKPDSGGHTVIPMTRNDLYSTCSMQGRDVEAGDPASHSRR